MVDPKDAKQLSDLADLLVDGVNSRKPVGVTISLDEAVYRALREQSGSLSFSRVVELILKRALERGAA